MLDEVTRLRLPGIQREASDKLGTTPCAKLHGYPTAQPAPTCSTLLT